MKKSVSLQQLTELVQGVLVGNGEVQIQALDALDSAEQGMISFLARATAAEAPRATAAPAVLVPLAI